MREWILNICITKIIMTKVMHMLFSCSCFTFYVDFEINIPQKHKIYSDMTKFNKIKILSILDSKGKIYELFFSSTK